MATQDSPQPAETGTPRSARIAKREPRPINPEPERLQYRALLIGNPNYFGNLIDSPLKPVKLMKMNTSYEELMCVGYNPQTGRLEAMVHIKRQLGYGGDICSSGTPEYVRFYLSYDDGATWADQGLASFPAFNIPGAKPLEYAAAVMIAPPQRWCFQENLPRVRAILSWNHEPPANTPNYAPVWGNIAETHIQVADRRLLRVGELLDDIKLQELSPLVAHLNKSQELVLTEPQAVAIEELHAEYHGKDVPAHRYLYPHLQAAIASPKAAGPTPQAALSPDVVAKLNVDMSKVIAQLLKTDGDTRYEELTCLGLNYNQDVLAATVRVKLPNGYSGQPCSAGSREYVAFWLDWGDGLGWTYVGTSSIHTHDYAHIPAGGLSYDVFLPVNLVHRRRPCWKGPLVVHVRAILSWETPPPPANPNWVPTWGNREETHILIRPAGETPPATHRPFIETAGNMAVTSIDTTSGLANGVAVGAGFTAIDSPFGGEVVLTGHVAYPPDVLGGGATPLKYRTLISDDGSNWHPLTDKFRIWLTTLLDGAWSGPVPFDQTPAPVAGEGDGWCDYLEDLQWGPHNAQRFVAENVLARWGTGGRTGLWYVKIEVIDPSAAGSPKPKWTSDTVTLRLDNQAPSCDITITSGGGACADFTIGNDVVGTYSVSDEHFGRLELQLVPPNGGEFTAPAPVPAAGALMPLDRYYAPPAIPTTGDSGTWTLKTNGLPRCGYVIYVHAWDRTIVNSGYIGWYNNAVVGLCLREA